MRKWLITQAKGVNYGAHHEWRLRGKRAFRPELIFTTVRNPYARCISLWKWEIKTGFTGGILIDSDCSLRNFMEILLGYQKREPNIYMNQTCYVDRSHANMILHLETINTELSLLPFWSESLAKFPRKNVNANINGNFADYLDRDTESMIYEYDRHAFDRFGYERAKL